MTGVFNMNGWPSFLPSIETFIYTALAFIIPLVIFKINQKFHKYGDPPWKKEEKGENEQNGK
ncbi:hypothetical protein J32TS6_30870 [Virgibacillus pantothenticus]|uniref:hypothetical protein n=2 Tax=Bacillaceae TaxID=186817 RepID=UPI000956F69C|nr:hypothetical protein [Virgibacillus pantothenticus]MBU8567648.1 hypothetical protein [Virgibacillus pantothenticus]MBU8648400.1 hypothetical protein [Virgibacillus pantothenticus]MBU8661050.1 hypothetical protein [Virgibacillus pantothenticus]MBU8670496.1 hypothetical protein [Virgibacillus pantothenticus]MBU8674652.1 hypothetical protein [Virgibacillus pantothenticus]